MVEDTALLMPQAPGSDPQTHSSRDLLLLGLAVVIILVMNIVFWGAASEFAPINPSTGRQINQGEPWD
jgi:hypothetical protein